jgi:hypothetical protein
MNLRFSASRPNSCPDSFRRSPPDYESGGQEFESLRARQHLATTYRAKIMALLRDLQGSQSPMAAERRPSQARNLDLADLSSGPGQMEKPDPRFPKP